MSDDDLNFCEGSTNIYSATLIITLYVGVSETIFVILHTYKSTSLGGQRGALLGQQYLTPLN